MALFSHELTIYPNPASHTLRFSKQVQHIEVIDSMGAVVIESSNTDFLSLQGLSKGNYLLRADGLIKRFIKN
jgi:hypothetical protein